MSDQLRFFNSGSRWLTCEYPLRKRCKAYSLWYSIKVRVTDLVENPSYADVRVAREWLDYQNFADWFYEQVKLGFYKDGWQLDKDILSPIGGRIYSPATCTFLPTKLNNILLRKSEDSECCNGVNFNGKKYQAVVRRGDLPRLSKCFDTEELAFDYYKLHKEAYIRYMAGLHKDSLPLKVVKYFMNYQVCKTN